MQYEEIIPKYHKKKQSSTSTANKKAKHKHIYKECLLIENGHPHRAEYCSICGKVGTVHMFETEKTESGYYRQLDYDEIFVRYPDLEKILVKDIFVRNIPVPDHKN